MKKIKPMSRIFIMLCSFGILMGILFPIYADFFIVWVPGKKTQFIVGCIIAGFLVGVFGYVIVKAILKRIDKYYKEMLFEKLNTSQFNNKDENSDLLLSMQEEFEELINQFDEMRKSEEKRLRELSITDCLTSLYNHRHFYEYITDRLDGDNQNISLLFCDIDRFKSINDTYGHTVGDCILADVAGLIKTNLEGRKTVFRYGGEEFIVVLEDYSVEQTREKAEQIRKTICDANIWNLHGEDLLVSISIGIAVYPEHGFEVKDLIEKADMAMYNAKHSGRNQCKIYDVEMKAC